MRAAPPPPPNAWQRLTLRPEMALEHWLLAGLDQHLQRQRMERRRELAADLALLAPGDAAVLRLQARQLEPDDGAGLQRERGFRHEAVGGKVADLRVDDGRAGLAQARREVDDAALRA